MRGFNKIKEAFNRLQHIVLSVFLPIMGLFNNLQQKILSFLGLPLGKRTRRGISSAGAAFLALGFVGVGIFGYLIAKGGGLSSLTGMADGIGLIVSLVVLIAGATMK